ncbi:unnamed protein product, partial [Choristocarpus tenellus]
GEVGQASCKDGVVVFLTGVTGLVGRMVLYDLLKQSHACQQGKGSAGGANGSRRLKQVFVLVRKIKGGRSAQDRLTELAASPMFEPLCWSGGCRGAIVTAVEGDLGIDGLGLTRVTLAELRKAGITHALHCAASVSFSDSMPTASETNVTGSLRVASLVASWKTCK